MWGRCPGSGRWGRNPSGKAYRECGSDGGDFIVPALTVEEAPEGRTLTRTTSPKKDSELPCPSSIFCSGKDTGFLGEILLFTMIFPKKVKEGFEIALHLFPWRLPSRIVCSHWGRGRVGGHDDVKVAHRDGTGIQKRGRFFKSRTQSKKFLGMKGTNEE